MKKFIFGLACFRALLGTSAFSAGCDAWLNSYPEECALQARYQELKVEYAKLGLNIEYINEYRSLRLLAREDYDQDRKRQGINHTYLPWQTYKPAPKTWIFWEKGNFYRERLNELLNERAEWRLAIGDLQFLHRKVVDFQLVGPYSRSLHGLPPYEKFFAAPGEIRKGMNVVPGFRGRFTEEEKILIEEGSVRTASGEPMVTGVFTWQSDGTYLGSIQYLDSSKVEAELSHLLDEVNSGVKRYLQGNVLPISPYSFAARAQRRFIAIHPFHESNGRMSRLIQDLILSKFRLPFLPGGDLQNDTVISSPDYEKDSKVRIAEMLGRLEVCLIQHRSSTQIEPGCRALYNLEKAGSQEQKEDEKEIASARQETRTLLEEMAKEFQRDLTQGKPYSGHEQARTGSESIIRQINQWMIPATNGRFSATPALFLDMKVKRKFLEGLAQPLAQDLITFTWVENPKAAFARKSLYTYPRFFRKFVLGRDRDSTASAVLGGGLYVSRNPLDSSKFAIQTQMLPVLAQQYNEWFDSGSTDPSDRILRRCDQYSRDGRLLVVQIKKNQRVLRLADESVGREFERVGITYGDLIESDADIVIDYAGSSLTRPENEWMVIKLRHSGAFEVREPRVSDFSEEQISKIRNDLAAGRFLGGRPQLMKWVKEYEINRY